MRADARATTDAQAGVAPSTLAARLREATAQVHEDAEHRGFVTALMGGDLGLDEYRLYLAQLEHVYRAMESRRPQPGDPAFLGDRGLDRADAIRADLLALGGTDDLPVLQATEAYVARVQAVHGDAPAFAAHHYTRYLGDVSGGQVIATMLRRHYGAGDEHVTFYYFSSAGGPVPIRRAYRAALDAVAWDAEEERRLVEEARLAFALNAALFDALWAVTQQRPAAEPSALGGPVLLPVGVHGHEDRP